MSSSTVAFASKEGVSASLNTVSGETKLSKWNNKAWLKLNQTATLIGSTKGGDKYKLTYGEYAVQVYEVPEGLEYEIILGKIPTSNVFTIPVATENLVFYYQPSLIAELNPALYDTITETEATKDGKVVVSRPINVVGSYAVYHSSKQGNEYKTGKAFHVYRPLVTAADGKTTWGILNFNGTSLTVTVDSAWLAKAKYPVVVDPTFGYTSVGASWDDPSSNMVIACKMLSSEVGVAVSMSVYLRTEYSITGIVNMAIYEDVTSAPDSLIGATDSTSPTTQAGAWHSADLTNSLNIVNTNYWLASTVDAAFQVAYDAGDADQRVVSGTYYNAGFPDPFNPLGYAYAANKLSIYVTYTAASTYSPKTRSSLPSTMLTMLNSKMLFG